MRLLHIIESSVSVDVLRLMLISHVLSCYPKTLFLAPNRMPREYIIFCRIIPTANTHLSTILFFTSTVLSLSPIRTLAYLNLEFSFFICRIVFFFYSQNNNMSTSYHNSISSIILAYEYIPNFNYFILLKKEK